MQKVLTAAEMREVDHLTTEEYGIPSIILMENAAHAVARVITEKLGGSVEGKSILILCGKGNNGGDGAALARILSAAKACVEVFLIGRVLMTRGDARINFEILQKTTFEKTSSEGKNEIFKYHMLGFEEVDSIREWIAEMSVEPDPDCVVDSLFGTGLDGELGRDYGRIFETSWFRPDLQKPDRPILRVAIDIPSGLKSDMPSVAGLNSTVDVTVTFTAPKPANILPEASNYNGELIVADIGSPPILVDLAPSQLFVTEADDASEFIGTIKFETSSYKNKRGHTLLIAGSEDYSGAAVLAGNAAMRSGVGLVTVVTPKSSKDSVASRVLPEVMFRGVAETENGAVSVDAFGEVGDLLEKADAVAIGCGLSRDESTREFVKKVVENRRQPVVVDADALNLLSPFSTNWPPANTGGSALILTPHQGEFLRLLGSDDKDSIKDRVAAVREFSQKHNVILVLKGERVLIGEPGGKVVVNPTGNSGLGKAGNGDTLTGIIAGFAAQAAAMKIDMFETAVAAVYVAGLAGDIAEKKYGKRVMTASDVRECLMEAFAQVELEK